MPTQKPRGQPPAPHQTEPNANAVLGSLLSAVYEQIATRQEREGGNLETLHPVMMEDVLVGCDVMPAAVHITSSTLLGAQPNVHYGHSRLCVMPCGRQQDAYVQAGPERPT